MMASGRAYVEEEAVVCEVMKEVMVMVLKALVNPQLNCWAGCCCAVNH
jgi:hypothetical protein